MAKKKAPAKKRIIKGRDFNEDKRQDGLRSAKSGGWRISGTNRKPTRKEIQAHYDGASNGVYMENRIQRIDRNTRAKKGERFDKGGSINTNDIKDLSNGYKEAVLFTSTDDEDKELDSNYSISDFDSKSNAIIEKMAKQYISDNKEAIDEAIESGMVDYEQIGRDVWYTQSGQGVGFFDRELDKEVEEKLTKGAKKFGDLSHHVFAQDGKVYIEGMKFSEGGVINNGDKYKEVNGTSYYKNTPHEVVDILERARQSKTRLKLYYGDKETGRDWHETMDTVGTIGRSNGSIKVPLLISTSRSTGGGAILTDSIVKIKDTKTGIVLYQHENYVTPKVEITASDLPEYTSNVVVDGEVYGRHKSLKSAEMLKNKLMSKGGEVKNRTSLTEEEKQFVREESQDAGQGYTYRAKVLRGDTIILKEKDGQPIQKFTVDNFEVASKMSAMLNKANDKENSKMAKGGKVDRTKSAKKTRVNRTKKAVAQDKNIKALHGGKRISADGNTYWENRLNRSDVNRTTKLAEGGGLKSYTSADLPKDGSPIEIHMPKMGDFPAEDITLKYNKDNFGFDFYKGEDFLAGRVTEKQVLDNLNNGLYEFKTDEFKNGGKVTSYKVGDVVFNKEHNTIGIVRDIFDRNDLRTDADGVVDMDSLEIFDKKNPKHLAADIAPSTKKELGKKFPDNVVNKAVTYYVAWSSYFDTNKYDVTKITNALEKIGAVDIHLENEEGMTNQPEVVVFQYKGDGTDYAPLKAVQKAFGTDYVIVRVKDWRTKKMAQGGAVKVSDRELLDLAKQYNDEYGKTVLGYESTWNKGLGEYEGEPIVYFGSWDDDYENLAVASGILHEGKLVNTTEAFDDWFKNDIDALRVAHELATNENAYAEEFKKGGEIKLKDIEDETVLMPYVIAEPYAETAAEITLRNEFAKWEDLSKADKNALDEKYKNMVDEISEYLVKRANTTYTYNETFRKDVKGKGTKGRDTLNVFMEHWTGIVDGKLVHPIAETIAKYNKESKSHKFEHGGEVRGAENLSIGDVYKHKHGGIRTILDIYQLNDNNRYAIVDNEDTDPHSQKMSIDEINSLIKDGTWVKVDSEKHANGGKLGFEGLAKKVAKEYVGDKVDPEYQDEYGKTYDKDEAKEVGAKVAAKVYRMQQDKMEQGGEIKGELTLSEIESKLGKTFGFWSVPYSVEVDGHTYRKIMHSNTYRKV